MADTVASPMAAYLDGLTATNTICVALGTTLVRGANLFIGVEPVATECVVIIPYGGAPPFNDGNRQEAAVQILLKTTSRKKALNVQQSIINFLHNNTKAMDSGKIFANQSTPILFGAREGGESIISVSNYTIKHVKI